MITPSQGYKFCIRLESELGPRQGSPERVFPKAPAPHIVCGAVPFSEKSTEMDQELTQARSFGKTKMGSHLMRSHFFFTLLYQAGI